MAGRPVLWRFIFPLGILISVVVLSNQETGPEIGAVAEAVSAGGSAEATAGLPRHTDYRDRSPLANRALPPLSPTLFGSVVAAPTVPSITPPPPQPPKPVAPPLPYTYLGQYRDADGTVTFYLRRDDKVIVTKPGTQLDERYRLEAEISNGLTFTFIPLMEAQVIPIGNPAQ